MEQALSELPMPITFLRPGWFMENAEWDVASARDKGIIASFLQPLDKAVPMVATADIGQVASELLQQNWTGKRVVELEGPKPTKQLNEASDLIHWPEGFSPKQTDAFVHNQIFINAPAKVIWSNLVNAKDWPSWYSNSADVQIILDSVFLLTSS
jgi:uncharacterized protein YbjT (DUF2867 family)